MAYNQYDLANTSLVKTGILTEMYIPLWWYSSGSSAGYSGTTAGQFCLQKGVTNGATSSSGNSAIKLHTLSSNWNSNQKFAFEVSIESSNASYYAYAQLWDVTANTAVTNSTVSTESTTYIVLRSSQFTLTPGHIYGVTVWSGGGSTPVYLTKASLIAFLS